MKGKCICKKDLPISLVGKHKIKAGDVFYYTHIEHGDSILWLYKIYLENVADDSLLLAPQEMGEYFNFLDDENEPIGAGAPIPSNFKHLQDSASDKQVGGNHYSKLKIQPMKYCLENGLNYAQSNAIKYITRYKDKNGVEDLKKAIHCIELLIQHEEGEL
jgi:hypothetical protein